MSEVELDLANVGGDVAREELAELGARLRLSVVAVPVVVANLEDLDLAELGGDRDQVVVAVDVVHVDVEHIRVELALPIVEEFG